MTVGSRERDGNVNISGVLVDRVTPGSQAAAMGVKAGDIIERVNEQAATTPAEAMDQLARDSLANGDLVALLVSDKAGRRWITLYVGNVYVAGLIATPSLPGGFGPSR